MAKRRESKFLHTVEISISLCRLCPFELTLPIEVIDRSSYDEGWPVAHFLLLSSYSMSVASMYVVCI